MKILSIVGARPNFIKLGPLSMEMQKSHDSVIVHTGQHYDREMSSLLFEEMGIPEPDYNLGINRGTTLEQITRMSVEISKILVKEEPDLVVSYGDTSSTVAGALASVYGKIPSAHIEAGPRNKSMIINEMVNRLIVDRVSTLLFCATRFNLKTLENEGMGDRAFFVGDLMYDAYLHNTKLANRHESLMKEYGLEANKYHVVTCHRAETTDDKGRLNAVVDSLGGSELPVLFPIHPRTEKMLRQFNLYESLTKCDNVVISKPLGYLEFLMLGSKADKIITDSGGVQREAFFMGKPCIVIYDESGWQEIEECGWLTVTGLDATKMADAINNFQTPDGEKPDIFGNGDAARKTLDIIEQFDFKNWDRC